MAGSWQEKANETVRTALAIAESADADEIRSDTTAGMGSSERALLFGLAAALAGAEPSEATEAPDAELVRLREENAQLRGILRVDDDEEPADDVDPDQLELANEEMRIEAFGDPDAEVPDSTSPVLSEGEQPAAAADPDAEVDPDAHSKDELIAMADAAGVSADGTKAEIAARLNEPA